jgi:hypothetical protein
MPELRIEIDPDDLAGEWIDQATQHRDWQRNLANKQDEFDRSKAALELTKNRLEHRVRRSPKDFKLNDKPSNDAIVAAVGVDPKHQQAVDNYLEAKKSLGLAKAAVESLYSRDKALQKLTDLYVHEYYVSRRDVDVDDNQEAIEERRSVRSRGRKRRNGGT